MRVLDEISLNIGQGESLGLVGESGSGKSTVAYITVGMYQPTSGTMYFRGEDLFGNPKGRSMPHKKEIQIVFQDPGSSLNPRRTIKSILDLPLRIHRPEKDRTREVLRILNMVELPPEYMHKYPRMLSGGEKQRVAIGRALLKDAPVLILDEATSSVDPETEKRIQESLERLLEGRTAVIVAHRLSTIRKADRILVVKDGRIAEEGDFAPGQLAWQTFGLNPDLLILGDNRKHLKIVLQSHNSNLGLKPPPVCTMKGEDDVSTTRSG